MLVRCLHYSISYSSGGQKIGDIFDLPKIQAENYQKMGWVEILPNSLQPEVKRGKKKKNQVKGVVDLSKSEHNGRFLNHIYK